jgi:hypothetical protein
MVAVPELPVSEPVAMPATGRPPVAAHRRRAVAVATSAMELFRPESDLARLLESFGEVDLLLACDDHPVETPGLVCVLGPNGLEPDVLLDGGFDDEVDDTVDDVHARAAALDLPDLQLHRLGLRAPLGPWVESDVLAAMSELVGFDPEPGVYCLAPALTPASSDPGRNAVSGAAQRIAQVYGIPLLRYRCLELSVVGEDDAR